MKNITVSTNIQAPVETVWAAWTQAEHIVNWNFASDEWHCPSATNDLEPGGTFSWRMEAKDGSMGFDYAGVYQTIAPFTKIEKQLGDGPCGKHSLFGARWLHGGSGDL